ncbi:MAG: hypothetical protein LBO66_08360 [Deltaproteobacteria bacterium]|jgi:hypothetical protein|nr:hypothetical protein [Deltaproteobacteria bacterium]
MNFGYHTTHLVCGRIESVGEKKFRDRSVLRMTVFAKAFPALDDPKLLNSYARYQLLFYRASAIASFRQLELRNGDKVAFTARHLSARLCLDRRGGFYPVLKGTPEEFWDARDGATPPRETVFSPDPGSGPDAPPLGAERLPRYSSDYSADYWETGYPAPASLSPEDKGAFPNKPSKPAPPPKPRHPRVSSSWEPEEKAEILLALKNILAEMKSENSPEPER